MPFPTEHAARQHDPKAFDSFRRAHPDGWPKGVEVIFGIKDGKSKIQSIRFKSSSWTVAAAKRWLRKHDFSTAGFEAATGPEKTETVKSLGLTITAEFCKIDEEKRLVYGPVLIPDVFDAQKDRVTAAEIEKAAHAFVAAYNAGTVLGDMHKDYTGKLALAESWIVPAGNTVALGKKVYASGTWLMATKVLDDALWASVKKGERRGYSIKGRAKAIPAEAPDAEGVAS